MLLDNGSSELYRNLPDFIKQLYHLQKFAWIGEHFPDGWQPRAPITASIGNICHLPSLTTIHLEKISNFPLSIFSACCHLESLTLIMVGFAKIGPNTLLAGSLCSSLKRLTISESLWSDKEAIEIIMTRAAPTLTTLILCNICLKNRQL